MSAWVGSTIAGIAFTIFGFTDHVQGLPQRQVNSETRLFDNFILGVLAHEFVS
jgi:hypothetical protein